MAPKRNATTSSKPDPSSPQSRIQSPFKFAPTNLTQFLDLLDKSKIYITHLDRGPAPAKQTIFLVPVILNLTIFILLIWRVYAAAPWYARMALAILQKEGAGEGSTTTWKHKVWLLVSRTLIFAVDYVLITVVWPWPISFFLERPGNPVSWRWRIGGFKETEMIVRVSRGWGREDLLEGNKKGDESPFWKTRISPNIDEESFGKSGYLLMGKDWDLDFHAMGKGQQDLVKRIQARREEKRGDSKSEWRALDRKIFAYSKDAGTWLIHDIPFTSFQDSSSTYTSQTDTDTPDTDLPFEGSEAARDQILKFKDKLTQMGKEDLFFKWINLVQEAGRNPNLQESRDLQFQLGLKVQALFEEAGVDWEQFAKDVGMA